MVLMMETDRQMPAGHLDSLFTTVPTCLCTHIWSDRLLPLNDEGCFPHALYELHFLLFTQSLRNVYHYINYTINHLSFTLLHLIQF